MQHLGFNEPSGEKARWEVHIMATGCNDQILEVTTYETTNHTRKTTKTYWALLERLEKTHEHGWLVGWLVGYDGVSAFVGYLMPKPFLNK